MFFWHWISVQWIERNRIFFAVLRMGKPTNFSQFNFALFRSFWYISLTDTDAMPSPNIIVYSQHKIIISQQQPSIGPNWIQFKLVRSVFFRCSCSIGMQHPKHVPDHPCKLILSFSFSSKIKRQKDAISPQRSLLCACSGLSRDTFKREKNNGFENSAKFHIRLWNQTLSIIRKCYPSLFAHFHNTLLHIILIFPRLWFKKTHLGTHWKDWGILQNNKFTFVCFYATVLSAFTISGGLFQFVYQFNKSGNLKQHLWRCSS
jgi:hypothetical protein